MLIASFILLAGVWMSTFLTPASFPDLQNIYIYIPRLTLSVSGLKALLQISHSGPPSTVHWQQHFYIPSYVPPPVAPGFIDNATESDAAAVSTGTTTPSTTVHLEQATPIQSHVLLAQDSPFSTTSNVSSNVLLGCFLLVIIFLFASLYLANARSTKTPLYEIEIGDLVLSQSCPPPNFLVNFQNPCDILHDLPHVYSSLVSTDDELPSLTEITDPFPPETVDIEDVQPDMPSTPLSALSSSEPSTPSSITSSIPVRPSTPLLGGNDNDCGTGEDSGFFDTTPKASKVSGDKGLDAVENVRTVAGSVVSPALCTADAEPVDDTPRPDNLSRCASPDADEVERLLATLDDPNRLAGSLTCSSMAIQVGLPDDAPSWLVAQRLTDLSEVQEGEVVPPLSNMPPRHQREPCKTQNGGRVSPPLRPVRGIPRRRVRGRFRDPARAKAEAARITHLQMLGIEVD